MNGEWNKLNRQARLLENEISLKLISFGKLQVGSVDLCNNTASNEVFCSDQPFNCRSLELEQKLLNLKTIVDNLSDLVSNEAELNTEAMFVLERHKEVYADFNRDAQKIRERFKMDYERKNFLHSVEVDIDAYKAIYGMNRLNDMHAKESEHMQNSDKLIDDQINIAAETREHLVSQRLHLKQMQNRMHDLFSRFPMINSLTHRINLRKRRDSIILGCLIGLCTFFIILYSSK